AVERSVQSARARGGQRVRRMPTRESPTQPHKESCMAKVLVLYHSFYGHVEAMASAVAEGARQVSGAKVELKRVPETVPAEVFQKAGGKSNQAAPIATPDELPNYDAIIFGTGTRFGNMTAQMRNFLDQTGPLWAA